MPPLCIHHGACMDGFTAAWVVLHALGDDVAFHAAAHGEAPPEMAGRDVVIVDFSYRRSVLEHLVSARNPHAPRSVLILDHHKTAAADLAGLPEPEGDPLGDRYDPAFWRIRWKHEGLLPIRCLFDDGRSGAQLAWDFFFPGAKRPLLVNYVGDRDLWEFKLPQSRAFNALVSSYEHTFDAWNRLHRQAQAQADVARLAEQGAAIERKLHKDVTELVPLLRRRMVVGGVAVWVANLPPTLASDAGNLMARGEPFACCYWDQPEHRVFSLRSQADGADVGAIASRYGGGGHRHAAGFRAAHGWEGE